MPLSAAQLSTLDSNQSAIASTEAALASADIAELEVAQAALDNAVAVQTKFIATLVADSGTTTPPTTGTPTFTAKSSGTSIAVSWSGVTPTKIGRSTVSGDGGAWDTSMASPVPVFGSSGTWTFLNCVAGGKYTLTLTYAGGVLSATATVPAATTTPPVTTPPVTTPPVTTPPVTTPPSTGAPAYPPSGGVGANIFNFDASTMPNGPLNSPLYGYWYNNTSQMNDVSLSAANVSIVNGQLVLKLASSSSGAAVTTSPWVGTGGPSKSFLWSGGYRETVYVVPKGSAWAAIWDTGQTWPADGEGDGGEVLGGRWTTNYHSSAGGNGPNVWPNQPAAGSTVTLGINWVPGKSYTSFLNGKQQVSITQNVSTDPHCLIINIGTGPAPDQLAIISDRVWAAA